MESTFVAGQAVAANQPALHRFSGELIFPDLYRIAMTSRAGQ
jgi:hypothetical protein